MKTLVNHRISILLAAALLLVALLDSCSTGAKEGKENSEKPVYVCSMHPQVLRDRPGDCPICGMALIDKKVNDRESRDVRLNTVVMPVNEAVLASVQTVAPEYAEEPVIIGGSGIINFDPRGVTTVSANYKGLIERSYIKYRFQPVKKGEKIFDIYCPEIYVDHMNYINLLRKFPDQPDLTRDAREWLKNIGLTPDQIRQVTVGEKLEFHLSVYSDRDGFVAGVDFDPRRDYSAAEEPEAVSPAAEGSFGVGLTEGTQVEEGDPLFKIVSLESVRADLKIRTEDAGLLREGQEVVITDVVSPGRTVTARVSQVEPLNGGLFQLVRVYIPDRSRSLYPGMKIQARITAGTRTALWVPKRAVMDLGQQQAVFVWQDSVFIATAVKTGLVSGDRVEIRSGIVKNARLAANASLLTDSDGFITTVNHEE